MTEALLEPRRAAAAVGIGENLVIIGGATGERPLDSVSMIINDSSSPGFQLRWKSIAPLTRARMGLAAVGYGDGIVIAGGTDGSSALADVEYLMKLDGSWIKRPSLSIARSGLALYSMGLSIIAAGGRGTTGITGACEILGFMKQSWKPCNRVPVPTAHPGFAELNGEAWFMGGIVRRDGKEFATDSVWIYDPKNDLWRKGPKLPSPMSHSAATFVDGTIFIAGGFDASSAPSPRVLWYDLKNNSWVESHSLPTPRAEAAATYWRNGFAVLGGRNRESTGLRVVEYYHWSGDTWNSNSGEDSPPDPWRRPLILPATESADALPPQATLTASRWGAAVIDYEGRPVMIGGADNGRFLTFVEALQPGGYNWRTMAPLRRARAGLAAATDGKRILTTGGSDQGGPMNFAEMYDPEAHDWFPIAPMLKARSGHALVWMADGRVCAWGGVGRDGPEPGVECWNGKTWNKSELEHGAYLGASMIDAAHVVQSNSGITNVQSFGGRMIRGGLTVIAPNSTTLYSRSTDKTQIHPFAIGNTGLPMTKPRANAAAAVLPHVAEDCGFTVGISSKTWGCGDHYFVVGGVSEDGAPSDKLEVFDKLRGHWILTAAMPTPRSHAVAFFRDGLLLVAGGKDASGNALDIIESYDPRSNRWASVSNRLAATRRKTAVGESEKIVAKVPIRPHDFAVIIGIENYRSLPTASYAEADARAYRRQLLSIGVPEENIVLLGGEKASRNDVVKYIEEWLPTQVQPDSRVYVIFSGHGAPKPDDGTAYLVPWDGDASFLKTTAYALDRFLDNLNGLSARQIFVVMDACFSGAGGRSVLARGVRPIVMVRTIGKSWDRLTIFSAAEASQIAGGLDDKKSGLFSYHMLNGLGGAADRNHDGHVTAAELYQYVRRLVVIDARREGREQTPTLRALDPSVKLY